MTNKQIKTLELVLEQLRLSNTHLEDLIYESSKKEKEDSPEYTLGKIYGPANQYGVENAAKYAKAKDLEINVINHMDEFTYSFVINEKHPRIGSNGITGERSEK